MQRGWPHLEKLRRDWDASLEQRLWWFPSDKINYSVKDSSLLQNENPTYSTYVSTYTYEQEKGEEDGARLFSLVTLEIRITTFFNHLYCEYRICKRRVWSLGQEDFLEEEMATHSSILAWRTPWTEEPGRLQSMGSQRVRQDWSDLAHSTVNTTCFFIYIY